MKKLTILLAALLLSSASSLCGQELSSTLKSGAQLYFSVTDTTAKTVELVSPASVPGAAVSFPDGMLDIPATVVIKDVTFRVTGIAAKAFEGADKLTYVAIPSTVRKIGADAFKGCTKLEHLVLPAAAPEIDKSAFADLRYLKAISFGSDWRSIDFSLFASSEDIESVFIPVKVTKITNLKALKGLKNISVDPNNPAFTTIDGMLYSRDGQTLYACPCGRRGEVAIVPGTKKILDGAFNGCSLIYSVKIPASVESFPYDLFGDCCLLSEIKMFASAPIMTAKHDGTHVFALLVATPDTRLAVPRESIALYRNAICAEPGEYESILSGKKEVRTAVEMLGRRNVVRGKDEF